MQANMINHMILPKLNPGRDWGGGIEMRGDTAPRGGFGWGREIKIRYKFHVYGYIYVYIYRYLYLYLHMQLL